MSVIAPSSTVLASIAAQGFGQARYDLAELSESSGSVATRLLGPPRWRARLESQRGMSLTTAGAWEAMVLQLRGSVNHLSLYDLLRPAPAGTLRGTLTISGNPAAGATSVTLAGGLATPNLISGGSFEIDTNVDGLADGLTAYAYGTTGAVTNTHAATGAYGTYAQRVEAANLGAGSGDHVGFYVTGMQNVTAGETYTLSCLAKAYSGSPKIAVYLEWYTAGSALISHVETRVALTGSLVRYAVSGEAPPTAAKAQLWVFMTERDGGAGAAGFEADGLVFEQAAAATDFELATIKAGDWLQIGTPGVSTSQLVKAVADATANDAGTITVTFEPPLRQGYSNGAAVAWDRALGYYKLQNDAVTWDARANGPSVEGFALDLLEQWT